ncbi:MAG: biopolymer transporter ExbD [Chlamydiia bacterium]|nr:biopolymer transporter ExbD [Chlamydiia bacterium]
MKFKTRLKPNPQLVDLTPLVDVIFLMLIFFVVTSNVLPLKSLDLETPDLEIETSPIMTQILVAVDKHQVIYVGSKKAIHDLDSLNEAILAEAKKLFKEGGNLKPTVTISIDKTVSYEMFLKLFARVTELNLPLRLSYDSP